MRKAVKRLVVLLGGCALLSGVGYFSKWDKDRQMSLYAELQNLASQAAVKALRGDEYFSAGEQDQFLRDLGIGTIRIEGTTVNFGVQYPFFLDPELYLRVGDKYYSLPREVLERYVAEE